MITGLSCLLFVLAASTHAEPASPSLTLDQAVTLALEQNQGLKALRGRVEEGKGELLLAETFPFNPVLKLDAVTDRPFAGEGEDRYGIALEQELQIAGQRGLRTNIAASRLVGIVSLTQDGERKLVRDVKLADKKSSRSTGVSSRWRGIVRAWVMRRSWTPASPWLSFGRPSRHALSQRPN